MSKPYDKWPKKDRLKLLDTPIRELKRTFPKVPRSTLLEYLKLAQAEFPAPPCPFSAAERAELALLGIQEICSLHPKHPKRHVHAWWKEARAERTEKRVRYRKDPKLLSEEEAAIWISQKEMATRKRQEYNEAMGHVDNVMRGAITDSKSIELAARYLNHLAKEEDAFVSQRSARSTSIAAARELLLWQHCEHRIKVLARHIKARPQGYARRKGAPPDAQRVLNALWTDQHMGAALDDRELPVGYDELDQRRAFAHVLQNALEYKRDYRDHTTLHIYDAGDNLEGYLQHDLRSGEPLADQFATRLHYLIQATEHAASQFPRVKIWVKPGNHDRSKLRHPGRATHQKWDSFQLMLGKAWQAACRSLNNVEFHFDRRPHAAVDVLGHWTYVTHGDTHLNVGNPGKALNIANISKQIAEINATRRYGGPFKVFAVGHVHQSVQLGINGVDLFVNGPLCPASGYADASGYFGDRSQWLWETTEAYAVGDMRRVKITPEISARAYLDNIIAPPPEW